LFVKTGVLKYKKAEIHSLFQWARPVYDAGSEYLNISFVIDLIALMSFSIITVGSTAQSALYFSFFGTYPNIKVYCNEATLSSSRRFWIFMVGR